MLSEALLVIGVSMVAFLSTSVDNLFLLIGFMSGERMRSLDVALGYAVAVAVVVAIALAGSWAADVVAGVWLRHLGWIPLGLGVWRLRALLRPAPARPHGADGTRRGGALPVFGVMLANSGDSLGVFVSLLGETSSPLVLVAAATALAMAGLWILLARTLVGHPGVAPGLRAIDRYAVPLLLVGVGLYILTDTPTDVE